MEYTQIAIFMLYLAKSQNMAKDNVSGSKGDSNHLRGRIRVDGRGGILMWGLAWNSPSQITPNTSRPAWLYRAVNVYPVVEIFCVIVIFITTDTLSYLWLPWDQPGSRDCCSQEHCRVSYVSTPTITPNNLCSLILQKWELSVLIPHFTQLLWWVISD